MYEMAWDVPVLTTDDAYEDRKDKGCFLVGTEVLARVIVCGREEWSGGWGSNAGERLVEEWVRPK